MVQVKFPQAALMVVILVGLVVGGVVAQAPMPSPTPSLIPTNTPVSGFVTPTPAATRVPGPQLPSDVEEALRFLKEVAQRYGLLGVIVVALLYWLWKSLDELILGLLGRIPTWVRDGRRNLPAWLGLGPDPATKDYLQKSIINAYKNLDLRPMRENIPLPITLESVYVPLMTSRGIGLETVSSRLGLFEAGEQRERLARLDELLPEQRYLVILGPMGTGKTTFARYVALILARAILNRRPDLMEDKLGWKLKKVPLPVLVRLGDFGSYLSDLSAADRAGDKSEILLRYLEEKLFAGLHLPEDFFRSRLERDRCLMLWDGLDEVAGEKERADVAEVLTAFARRYPGCRYVATCRPEGYRDAARLADFYPAVPARFRMEEIETFVHLWYREAARILRGAKLSGPVTERTEEEANDLIHRIETNPAAREMAENPLLLTVITLVHFAGEPLPERRAKLYSRAVSVLLTWDKYKPMEEYPAVRSLEEDTRRQYLEEVAFNLQEQGGGEGEGARSASYSQVVEWLAPNFRSWDDPGGHQGARNFLKWVVERSYLMQVVGERLEFPHRAFQEYLAARHVAKRDEEELIDYLRGVLDKSWWEETVLLTPAHLSLYHRDKARRLLQAIAREQDPPGRPYHNLVLAARALADVERRLLGEGLEEEIAERLVQAIADENPAFAVETRIQAGEALSALGDPRPGVCTLEPELVKVPAGRFLMGSPPEEVEGWKKFTWERIEDGTYKPPEGWTKEQLFEVLSAWLEAEEGVHEIDVPGFFIARYPVTNAQFAFFEEEGYDEPKYWTKAGWRWRQGEGEGWGRPPERRDKPMFWHDPRFNRLNQPVVGITWYEAVAYCNWLTEQLHREEIISQDFVVCLPTEAEWEKAARGGLFLDGEERRKPNPLPRRTWTWGDEWDENKANTWEGPAQATTPVGLYPAGRSPYGVLDMIGNVWEWTNTRWGTDWLKPDYSPPYRCDDRENPEGVFLRVLRGGSWGDLQNLARCAYRYGSVPGGWGDYVGFRVVVAPALF